MAVHDIEKDDIDAIIGKLELESNNKTVDKTQWRNKTEMELVGNICEMPHTSGTTAYVGTDIMFGNEASREDYRVFTIFSKPAQKGLFIK